MYVQVYEFNISYSSFLFDFIDPYTFEKAFLYISLAKENINNVTDNMNRKYS